MSGPRTQAAAGPVLVTKGELALALKISPKTVERWSRTGEVPVKIDRPHFKRYVLAEVIEALAGKSAGPDDRAADGRPRLISDLMAGRKGGRR